MSTILGPQDVAELVATFPPTLTDGGLSLIRTSTGDSLIDFGRVLRHLESLIRDSTSRVAKGGLSALLNVEADVVPALLRCSSKRLCYDRDGQFIIPRAEEQGISDHLVKAASFSFVNCSDLCQSLDINADDLLHLLKLDQHHTWKWFTDGRGWYVCDSSFWEQTMSEIMSSIESSGSEIVDLTALAARIPLPVVEEIRESIGSANGELRVDAERVVFVPSGSEVAKLDRSSRFQAYIQEIERKSYCMVEVGQEASSTPDRDDFVRSIVSQYDRSHPHGPRLIAVEIAAGDPRKTPRRKEVTTPSFLLITSEALRHHVDEVKRLVAAHAERIWIDTEKRSVPTDFVLSAQQYGASGLDHDLTTLLTNTEYMKELEDLALKQISFLQNKDQDVLAELMNERLVIPLQLYALAIGTILDPVLKQNLQSFVMDYFRTHFVGPIVREASEKKITADKQKNRDFDRLHQSCQQAKTFDDLKASVARLTKKLKIPNPQTELLDIVKKRLLKSTFRSEVQHQTVASVLLQNTIWLLLAHKSEGIFISAGKDTSRMIKQYQAIGDAEVTQKLLHWRDLTKTGQAGQDVLADMTDTAKRALQSVCKERDIS